MRTTLTIDDSIMEKLKEVAHQSGVPLKQVVNTTLEIGLRELPRQQQRKKYQLKTHAMGVPRDMNLDKALHMASMLEDDEIVRKLKVRK
jgi:hypothetical protein